MKHTTRAYAGIVGVLGFLVIGCTPVAGVDDNYGESPYTGSFGYTAQPSYYNGNFGVYGLGYPVYTSRNIAIEPEWVTTPSRYPYNYPGYHSANFSNRGDEPLAVGR